MRVKHIYLLGISILLSLLSLSAQAQTEDTPEDTVVDESRKQEVKDSIRYTNRYGLRLGGDAGKLIRTVLDDDYKGFEINADFRLTRRLYIAGELGTEEKTTATDFLNATASGSYFKAGIDYNSYNNWLGMENAIFTGIRVGASTFKQTLNSFTVYTTDQYWDEQFTSTTPQEFTGLTALWTELIVGIKAEVLPNLYLGVNGQLKILLSWLYHFLFNSTL